MKSIIQDLITEIRQTRTGEPVVLIVEDNEFDAQLMSFAVIELGGWVAWAKSGAQALQRIDSSEMSFDVVLLDLRMPGMDGVDTLRLIRKKAPDLPVIVVSHSPSDDPLLIQAKALGCLGPVKKPRHGRELHDMLSQQHLPSGAGER